jgi:nucleotide-binding universal stress UspA family protein
VPDDRPHLIVVGIDGSANAQSALEWAVGEARARHGRLRVVHSWSTPYDWQVETMFPVDEDKLRDAARARLERAVDAADTHDVDVERTLLEGDARHVLVDAARDADLLVVGTRGHGRMTEALLGSVSMYCAHHAGCPVVLVPPDRRLT